MVASVEYEETLSKMLPAAALQSSETLVFLGRRIFGQTRHGCEHGKLMDSSIS